MAFFYRGLDRALVVHALYVTTGDAKAAFRYLKNPQGPFDRVGGWLGRAALAEVRLWACGGWARRLAAVDVWTVEDDEGGLTATDPAVAAAVKQRFGAKGLVTRVRFINNVG